MKIATSKNKVDFGFYIDTADVESVWSARIREENSKVYSDGRRREDVYSEFSFYRPLGIDELHPELSSLILNEYDMDPYSEKSSVEAKILSEDDNSSFLRVANSVEAYYFGLNERDSDIISDTDYMEAEYSDWI